MTAASQSRSVPTAAHRSPLRATSPYRASSTWRAAWQLGTTLLPLGALFWLMYASLGYSYWVTLALAVPTAGFLVRTFIIMHDCAHGSFVRSRRANDVIGFITGAVTLTPFAQWRRDHALHHASSGDLDRRGHGDVLTLTVDEYRERTAWGRLKYRLYRHPVVLFGLGPLFLVANQQWHALTARRGGGRILDVLAPLGASVTMIILLSVAVGPAAVLLIYGPVLHIAGAAGIWLFYVQHQFEDTYWRQHAGWEYADAALRGSSYYRLPRVLEWLTASIGLHHVHHVDPKVPNYNLRRCHDENTEFHQVTVLSVRDSLRTAALKLWDVEAGRLVRFDALRSAPMAESRRDGGASPRSERRDDAGLTAAAWMASAQERDDDRSDD